MRETNTTRMEQASRYLDYARQIIVDRSAINQGTSYYLDAVFAKYAQLAGHTAYTGIVVALDTLFSPDLPTQQAVDWQWYKTKVATIDKHQSERFYSLYSIFRLSMECDGICDEEIATIGFREANRLFDWIRFQFDILTKS